jgi:catechol 2,3-dioxygenase-like lactoylglutathione lyase family enzyme
MQILSVVGIVLPADDADAARAWYADTLGLPPSEEVDGALDVNDVAVSFAPQAGVRFVGVDLPDGPTVLTDPWGSRVELVEPDLERAAEAERHISAFVEDAGQLGGPPVDELVAATAAVLRGAREELSRLMKGVPHNKVLATQLALSQRARELPNAQPDWSLHAASTLLSGLVISGAERSSGD